MVPSSYRGGTTSSLLKYGVTCYRQQNVCLAGGGRPGCNAQGNLVHTSQSCTRTHRLWCDRHDSVLGLIIEKIESRGHEVIRELSIPTGEGRRKLDLVAQVDSVAHVVDVTITSDCNNMMRGKKSAIMRDSMPSTGLRKFFWAAV